MSQPTSAHRSRKAPKKPLTARQKLLRIILITLGVLLTFSIISVIVDVAKNSSYYSYLQNGGSGYEPLDILFAPADYEENILEDPNYLAMNRDIKYIEGAQSTEVSLDEDGSYYSEGLRFFQTYFKYVIDGDYEQYVTLFSESYDESISYPIPKTFTMQKIHSISVDYRRYSDITVSKYEKKHYYVVKYQIYQNNGTFRDDIRPTDVLPLLFELTTVGDDTKITRIIKYTGV